MFTRTSYSLEISTVQRCVGECWASSWRYIRVCIADPRRIVVAALRIRDVCQAKGGGTSSPESDARQQLNNCAMHMLICASVPINMYVHCDTEKNCSEKYKKIRSIY